MSEQKKPVIGIPRGMLYYRYGCAWETFFRELGVSTVLSPESSRSLLETGTALAPDESCLTLKMFLGHVQTLPGKCDRIFIPRYSSFSANEVFCTRFEAMYDLCRNLFRKNEGQFITCNIDAACGSSEEKAFESLGVSLGFSAKKSRNAWKTATEALAEQRAKVQKEQEENRKKTGTKILVAGHSYVLEDSYLGKPILEWLKKNETTVLRADCMDPKASLKAGSKFSPTCRWLMSEEIIGGTVIGKDYADGIMLVSAFPCGPDAMTNELLIRRIRGIPILTLILDAQSGTAGVETRMESFLDIIHFQQEKLGGQA